MESTTASTTRTITVADRKYARFAAVCIAGIGLILIGCGGGSSGGNGGGSGGGPGTPFATLSASSLTFGKQDIDSTGPAQSTTLTNTGTAALAISSATASGDFAQTNDCPANLAPGASCTFHISFIAAAAGIRTGAVTIDDSAAGGSQSITLTGTGGDALFYVALNGLDSWSGTLPAPNSAGTDGPFLSIDHARAVVQGINKTGLNQITVQIRGGTYYLPVAPAGQTTSLSFGAADSGTANTEIVYENYPNENPIISGGMRVTGWNNVHDNVWTAALDPTKVRYFENLYYNGARRLRPRVGGYLGASPWLRVFAQVTSTAASDAANCPGYANN